MCRLLAYALVERTGHIGAEPHPVRDSIVRKVLTRGGDGAGVAQFLCLELPGGSRWLPLVVEEWGAATATEAPDQRRRLLAAARRHRVWRRRGTLLLLRCLRGAGRSHVRACASTHAAQDCTLVCGHQPDSVGQRARKHQRVR